MVTEERRRNGQISSKSALPFDYFGLAHLKRRSVDRCSYNKKEVIVKKAKQTCKVSQLYLARGGEHPPNFGNATLKGVAFLLSKKVYKLFTKVAQ